MAKKFEFYKQGKDLYIVCRNADEKCLSLISHLLEIEEEAKEIPDVLPLKEEEVQVPKTEDMEEVSNNKMMQNEIVLIKYGKYAGQRPLDVMKENGPKALAEMYQLFGKLKKDDGTKKSLKMQIKEDIKEYVLMICKDGFQADTFSLEEVKEILLVNEKDVFRDEISQILQQAGVTNWETFVKESDEVLLKGALSCCMNSLYKRVSSQ